MKVAFLIDNSQTLQSIVGLVGEFSRNGHECVIHCTFDMNHNDQNLVSWKVFSHRGTLLSKFLKEKDQYDKTIGINMFNNIWSDMYEKNSKDTFAVEYCWNELYNHKKDFKSNTTLFTNTEWSRDSIVNLTEYDKVKFLGSPWFEFISQHKSEKRQDYIVFMAPHNSYFQKFPQVGSSLLVFLNNLKEQTNKMGLKLVLKTRKKYGSRLISLGTFDEVVTDENPFDHLKLYSQSRGVFHFCSSALMELAFLEVPSVSMYPGLHKALHDTDKFDEPVKLIADRYYSGDIHDSRHSHRIGYNEYADYELLKNILDNLGNDKNWSAYKSAHFSGDHTGASKRIMDLVTKC